MPSTTATRRRVLEALAAAPFAAGAFPAFAQGLPMASAQSLGFSPAGLKAMDDQFHALVDQHIPEFAGLKVKDASGALVDQKSPMLMKQLVSHSAGFDRSAGYANAALQATDLQGMIDKLSKLPLAFQPGTDWRYGPSVD